jgi:hypothetical protein
MHFEAGTAGRASALMGLVRLGAGSTPLVVEEIRSEVPTAVRSGKLRMGRVAIM